ncbi:hypothetical protein C2S52_015787 [Perilla frutescens var. hirtella]|nr:hypothetical protein C2S52_015787 [Perilla frutescens var. hirtella]
MPDTDEEREENDRTNLLESVFTEFCGWIRDSGRMTRLMGMTGQSTSNTSAPDTSEMNLSNWVVPLADLDIAGSLAWVEPSAATPIGALFLGATFRSKDDLAMAVGMYHMQNRVEYAVYRSNKKRLGYICKHGNGCPFKLNVVVEGGIWRIYKFDNTHTCHMDMGCIAPCQVPARVIAKYFARKLINDGVVLKPRAMMAELVSDFGIQIDYSFALRSRNIAIEMIYGDYEKSYEQLPAFLHMLQTRNPGTLYDIQMTHQHQSIINAVEAIFPNAAHGLCYYHLLNKMTKYGHHVAALFYDAAYSYQSEVFQKNMSVLEVVSKDGAYMKLCDIGAQRWSRSQCPVRRFSFMTSNAAETLNARLLWARRLPICSLLEVYRSIVEKWFVERRAAAHAINHALTKEAANKLSKNVENGRCLSVYGTTSHLWKVEVERNTYHVDLEHWSCDCREFDLDLIPCYHAAAAIRHAGLHIYDFVHDYYKLDSLLGTYGSMIVGLPHPDEWSVPVEQISYVVKAPVIDRQAGRPKHRRARGGFEASSDARRHVCTRCQLPGHNRRVCTAYVPTKSVDFNVPAEDVSQTTTRRRAPKKCSICGETSHTKRRCPLRVED